MTSVTNHSRYLSSHLDLARQTYPVLARRPLGATGLHVGEIGVGTSALGGGPLAVPDEEAIFTLGLALDMQASLVDIRFHGGARALDLAGRAMRGRRTQAVVCLRVAGGPDDLTRGCETALKALGTDHVDLLLWDHPGLDELKERDTPWAALAALRQAGKTLCVGAAVEGAEQLRAAAQKPAEVLAFGLNVFDQAAAPALAEAAGRGLGLIANRVLDSGWLAGRYGAWHVFLDGRSRWTRADRERRGELQRAFEAAALEPGVTAAQAAIRFVLGFPGVACAVASVSDWHQVVANVDAARVRLDPGRFEALRALWEARLRGHPLAL